MYYDDAVTLTENQWQATVWHRELGLITSLYYCVGIYPNTFARSNFAEAVWGQWKTVATGSDGYLRWAYDSFVEDPFTTVDFRAWESGDTAQVYPGCTRETSPRPGGRRTVRVCATWRSTAG